MLKFIEKFKKNEASCGRKRKRKVYKFNWQLSQTISHICVCNIIIYEFMDVIYCRWIFIMSPLWIIILLRTYLYIHTDICSIKLNENSSFFHFYYFPLIALIIEIVMSGLQSNNFKISHLNYWKEFLLSIDFAFIIAAATSHKILAHEFMLA